ncbi:MAG: hypothetical protein KatS3mg054_0081 [Chloroflexus sp.]|nr:MAG: hypothetical protein KatS3mg054_0081 [Chloroflexus sp.]
MDRTWSVVAILCVFAAGAGVGIAASQFAYKKVDAASYCSVSRIVDPIGKISENCSKMREDCLKAMNKFEYLEMLYQAIDSRTRKAGRR